jgi:hypothetical protein
MLEAQIRTWSNTTSAGPLAVGVRVIVSALHLDKIRPVLLSILKDLAGRVGIVVRALLHDLRSWPWVRLGEIRQLVKGFAIGTEIVGI